MGHLILLVRGHQGFNLVVEYASPFVIQMFLLVGPISNHFNHLQVSVDLGRWSWRPFRLVLFVRTVFLGKQLRVHKMFTELVLVIVLYLDILKVFEVLIYRRLPVLLDCNEVFRIVNFYFLVDWCQSWGFYEIFLRVFWFVLVYVLGVF